MVTISVITKTIITIIVMIMLLRVEGLFEDVAMGTLFNHLIVLNLFGSE